MYGGEKRIGLIVPSANIVNEPEFYSRLPTGVSLHTARMKQVVSSIDNQIQMSEKMESCAEKLKTAEVDVVVFGCTSGSLVKGPGYEKKIEDKLYEITGGIPSIATAASIKRAFRTLGLDSLVVTTPYPTEIDKREREFLEDSGYKVLHLGGPNIKEGMEKGEMPSDTVASEAKAVDSPDADGVFISCTNCRTFDIITSLEEELGKPVVTSNQATLWNTLQALGIDSPDIGLGELFNHSLSKEFIVGEGV